MELVAFQKAGMCKLPVNKDSLLKDSYSRKLFSVSGSFLCRHSR